MARWSNSARAGATAADLEAAITAHTAAIFVFYKHLLHGRAGAARAADRRRPKHGIPLVVDAAAQLPPVENLWQLTGMGADLALFSGGKGLCGPQSSGLILGRQDLIDACAFNACPRGFIGRPMKVGKEEIVGLMTAVRLYIEQDHEKLLRSYEEHVAQMMHELNGRSGLQARRSFPSEAGQPHARPEVTFDPAVLGFNRDEIVQRLIGPEPSRASWQPPASTALSSTRKPSTPTRTPSSSTPS